MFVKVSLKTLKTLIQASNINRVIFEGRKHIITNIDGLYVIADKNSSKTIFNNSYPMERYGIFGVQSFDEYPPQTEDERVNAFAEDFAELTPEQQAKVIQYTSNKSEAKTE